MNQIQIDSTRMVDLFQRLTSLDAESLQERQVADVLKRELTALGFQVEEDRAGKVYGSDTGNLYGFLPGTGSDEGPVLFSAHMDTVPPGIGKQPVLQEDGRIVSAGDTVLGADDVSGLTEILEGIRGLIESGKPRRDVEVLFTIAEEVFGKGARVFDFSKVQAKEAFVLDMSGPVGSAAIQAPTIISFRVEVTGRASHAGFAPEKGIHSILAAANAIHRIPQGRVSEETTVNVGTIQGGKAENIVPEHCVCTGEVRSFSHEEALAEVEKIRQVFQEEAEALGAGSVLTSEVKIEAYRVPENAGVCRHFQRAAQKVGRPGELKQTLGGSDNNIITKKGIEGIVLSCGMYQTHSTQEYTIVEELVKGAELVAALAQAGE